jgi:hypothetical protein
MLLVLREGLAMLLVLREGLAMLLVLREGLARARQGTADISINFQ